MTAPSPAPSSGRVRSDWPRRAAVLSLSTLACLLTCEAALRYAAHRRNLGSIDVAFRDDHPVPAEGRVGLIHIVRLSSNDRIIYELKPGLDRVTFKGRSLTTNARGFRGPEIPPATKLTRTLVAIGDSILFGHGVGDEDPYVRLLEARLNEDAGASVWRAVNTGVPGYNTVMQVETLREKCLDLEPDVVLWSLVSNDLDLPAFIRVEEDVWSADRSFALDWVREKLGTLESRRGQRLGRAPDAEGREQGFEGDPDKVPARYRDVVGWPAFRAAADELCRLSEEHDFRVIAFATYEDELVGAMLDEAARRGFATLSLMDDLTAHMEAVGNHHYKYTDLVVSPLNTHPSPLQHEMAADKLFAELTELGWSGARRDF